MPTIRLTWILTESGPSSISKALIKDNIRLERLVRILQPEMEDIPAESGGPGSGLDLRPDVEKGNKDVSGAPPPYVVTQRDPSPLYGHV
ncbi:hypothetical protein H0H93_008527 [Arthromyces matolae]|nr:hypothetical protein H0H93_008527 [Arthromyces matolae]